MLKVYLSKSNLADPLVYTRVRTKLRELDCQLFEYSGKPDEDVVTDCDIFLIVPPAEILRANHAMYVCDEEYNIGKGQYVYINAFMDMNMDWEVDEDSNYPEAYTMKSPDLNIDAHRILAVTSMGETEVYVDSVIGFAVTKQNWKDRYAQLDTGGEQVNLQSLIPKKVPIQNLMAEKKMILDALTVMNNSQYGAFPCNGSKGYLNNHLACAVHLGIVKIS